jgi:DNA polymerase-3 subunit chi
MTRIDFYLIPEANNAARLNVACRLIEKAYKLRHRVYIQVNNQIEAFQLDELLWTYRDDSFLPHNLYGEGPLPAPPIQIGFNGPPEKQRDILINLSQSIPEFYTQFTRVLELVTSDPVAQTTAREHYRTYRTQGHDITTHKLQSIEA